MCCDDVLQAAAFKTNFQLYKLEFMVQLRTTIVTRGHSPGHELTITQTRGLVLELVLV